MGLWGHMRPSSFQNAMSSPWDLIDSKELETHTLRMLALHAGTVVWSNRGHNTGLIAELAEAALR